MIEQKPRDYVRVMSDYLALNKLEPRETLEGTVNVVLESIQSKPENVPGQFRDELISCCAISLNGLSGIKDPIRLYRNLALVFEPRGHCIFGDTVNKAFLRVQGEAIIKGRSEELLAIVAGLKNPFVRTILGSKIPSEQLQDMIYSDDLKLRENAARALALKRSTRGTLLDFLLNNGDVIVSAAAASALPFRNDLKRGTLEHLLAHNASLVRYYAANALARRFPKDAYLLKSLRLHPDHQIVFGSRAMKRTFVSNLRFIRGPRASRNKKISELTKRLVRGK